jgi:hypothetical protein
MSDREKKKRRSKFGISEVPPPGWLEHFRWRVGWGRDHSFGWVMHAVTHGDHRAWLSPATSKDAALADLDELGAQIRLGEEPRPSHAPD